MDSKELAGLAKEVEREFRDRVIDLGADIGRKIKEVCPPGEEEDDCSGSMALSYVLELVGLNLGLAAHMVTIEEVE